MTRAMILTLLATLPLSACQVAAAQSAPFSPVIEANGVLYIAGHLGYEAESRKFPNNITCLLYTSPSPRDQRGSRMPSSA